MERHSTTMDVLATKALREAKPRDGLKTSGLIDRTKPLRFRCDGENHTGFQIETLASALLASGLPVRARGFKYHRPRGF
ncbi:MAG: 2Fe-2S iron-sulfur cluster-binding protein [Sedimentitalea sp.]